MFGLSGGWLLSVLLLTGAADGQSSQRYAVKWSSAEGAESCPRQAELTAAVEKLVPAGQIVAPELADRMIFGQASRDESWRATLRVVDAAGSALGERELKSEAASCSELAASVALAIALIIDPEHIPSAVLTQEGTGVASAAPAASAASAAPAAPAAPADTAAAAVSELPTPVSTAREATVPVREVSAALRRSVKASAVVLSGLLPEVAVGAQLEFWQPLQGVHSLRFALAYLGAQTSNVRDRDGASATLYVVTARAAYCPLLAASRKLSVFGCAGLESGVMVGHGRGGGYANSPALGLLALDGALTLDRTLAGPWAMSLTAGAALTPFRPTFLYQTAEGKALEVQRRSALEGRLEIGVAYRF